MLLLSTGKKYSNRMVIGSQSTTTTSMIVVGIGIGIVGCEGMAYVSFLYNHKKY